jgi:hypothetical protein
MKAAAAVVEVKTSMEAGQSIGRWHHNWRDFNDTPTRADGCIRRVAAKLMNRMEKMFNRISAHFYEKPGRLTTFGKTVALTGAGLLVAAAWGNFATGSINILPTLAGQPSTSKTLADIYPSLSLWWIPESGWGVFAALVLVAAGLLMNAGGRWIDRLHNMR